MKRSYRWLVLAAFMLVTFINQASWITFAPITSEAARHYGTSDLVIGLLSMVFMIVYVLLAIPSAWVIDSRGFRLAVSVGALLTAVGALARGVFSADLTLVFVAQVGIAVGQPLILGSITKLAAGWFPAEERATAAGLATLSIYLGILAAMILTPMLTLRYAMRGMLMVYGFVAAGAAVIFLAVARERAPGFGARADVRRAEGDAAQPGFHPAAGHLLHRAGPVQRGHHLDRGDRAAAGASAWPRPACWAAPCWSAGSSAR